MLRQHEVSVPFRHSQNQNQNVNQPHQRIVENPQAPMSPEEEMALERASGLSEAEIAQNQAFFNQFRNMHADVLGDSNQIPQIYPEIQ
jgi:hypothetical protein